MNNCYYVMHNRDKLIHCTRSEDKIEHIIERFRIKQSARYEQLKFIASQAVKKGKVFEMYGKCEAVRTALVNRGWVEKIKSYNLNLKSVKSMNIDDLYSENGALERILLAQLVQYARTHFIWNARDDWDNEKIYHDPYVKYNRLQISHLWATKLGLCAALRNSHWYHIDDVAEVNYPRTYNCVDEGEKEEFQSDFKLTACTSLLKWVLSMVANERPIFNVSGNIAINVLVFALNRCKEYLFSKKNKDVDNHFSSVTTKGQWNAFLKNYYFLIAKQDTFEPDKENKLPLFLSYAKYLLKEIHEYRPQLSCEGCLNIWIIKPAHCSRGRGIRMASKLRVLTDFFKNGKYVFQKYIEEPLLIHDTKFDIRQYYLITNTFPLVIWMYKECYLKFSSQRYDLKSYHEAIHLTNNAVQKKYTNCDNRHPELEQYNMWNLETFKKYLKNADHELMWENIIYPGMKRAIVGVMTSCQESISDCRNRFELYGCDFILDKSYKPWLIEINSCPDFNPTTPVTAQICPAVLHDMIKVIIDLPENSKARTGKFECIFHQTIDPVIDIPNPQLVVRGKSLPNSFFIKGNPQVIGMKTDSNEKLGNMNDLMQKFKMIEETDLIMQDPDVDSAPKRKTNSEHSLISNDEYKDTSIGGSSKPNIEIKRSLKSQPWSDNVGKFSKSVHNFFNWMFDFYTVDDQKKNNENYPYPNISASPEDRNISEEVKTVINYEQHVDSRTENLQDYFMEATNKMFSFLSRKERDYVC